MLKSKSDQPDNRPEIQIAFRTNENGDPLYIDDKGTRHFKIRISIQNIPGDSYAVNYQLHPSYISSFREQRNREEDFAFNTTTYGDYIISAEVMGKKINTIASGLVSDLINKYYSGSGAVNNAVTAAITKIKLA
ncbi:MAG TPA: pYEATS domain-containing protein [Chitinophagaceae bacterium]